MAPILLCTKHVINRNMVTKMKPNTILTVLAIATTFGAMPAHAASCSFSDTVAITGIKLDSTQEALPVGTLNPTACIVVSDNISGNYPEGSNIGTLNEGVLNGGKGEGSNTQIFNPYFLPPSNPSTGIELNLAYLPGGASTYPQEQLVNDKDPGWIKLYSYDRDTSKGEYGANPTLNGKSLVISDLMTISVPFETTSNGRWGLDLNPNIITEVQRVLGRNAFDHLAFVLKSGTKSIVYDFDFNVYAQYFVSNGDPVPFDYMTPYDFTGTWSTLDFGSKGLSHIEIWARDPDGDQTVPEPASLALLGLGFSALGLSRRKSKQQ